MKASTCGGFALFVKIGRRGNQLLKCVRVKCRTLLQVDGAAGACGQARIEQSMRVRQGSAMGKGQLDLVLVGLACSDDACMLPYGHAGRI